MSRLRRFAGIVRLGIHRTALRVIDSRQVTLSILGVAFTIMLMTTVGGIAVGLASQQAIQSEDVDYWVVPEASSTESIAVTVDGPKLGDVHQVTSQLSDDERIQYVTPVETRILQLNNSETNNEEYVLVTGVIPAEGKSVAGLSLSPLTPGDPYYENGSFNGTWTGELVISEAAAQLLAADTGTTLRPTAAQNQTFTVVDRQEATLSTGTGSVPVVVVHLAELQRMSGSTGTDQAGQLLIQTNDPSVRGDMERLDPETEVVTRSGLSSRQLTESSLPLAVAITTLLTVVGVGVLLVATTMGLAVTDDRQFIATLSALGFSASSRLLLVLVEVLTVTVLGGVLGVVFGIGGIVLTNLVTRRLFNVEIAVIDVRLLLAGLLVSVIIGVLSAGYPLWLSRRTNVIEVIDA